MWWWRGGGGGWSFPLTHDAGSQHRFKVKFISFSPAESTLHNIVQIDSILLHNLHMNALSLAEQSQLCTSRADRCQDQSLRPSSDINRYHSNGLICSICGMNGHYRNDYRWLKPQTSNKPHRGLLWTSLLLQTHVSMHDTLLYLSSLKTWNVSLQWNLIM